MVLPRYIARRTAGGLSPLPVNGLGQPLENRSPVLGSSGWSAPLLRSLNVERFTRLTQHLPARDLQQLFGRDVASGKGAPQCPDCRLPLELDEVESPQGQTVVDAVEVRGDDSFETPVWCRKLVVHRGADARFARPVQTQELVVNGELHGSITCYGPTHIAATGRVIGQLKTQTLALRPGGTLDGEFQVVDTGKRQPPRPDTTSLVWVCPNRPRCATQVPAHPSLKLLSAH